MAQAHSIDEKFSNLAVEGLPHTFSISTLFNKYYIYHFNQTDKKEIDKNEYERLRYRMQKIAKMSNNREFDTYFKELQNLLDIWKEKFND